MSHQQNDDDPLRTDAIAIPRKSPRTWLEPVEGLRVELTWYNTVFRLYHHPYRPMGHIQIATPEGITRTFFLEHDQTYEELIYEKQFPVRIDAEPDDDVLAEYFSVMKVKMERDIDSLY